MLTWLNAIVGAVDFLYKQIGAIGCFLLVLGALLTFGFLSLILESYTWLDIYRMMAG